MNIIKRNILLNPGPATTTNSVKYAQIVPDICPREKEFVSVMKQIRRDLLRIVYADINEYTSVLFCGSGTINMDICLNSLLPKNKKILIINNGAYSQRAVEICKYYGLPFINLKLSIKDIPNLCIIEKNLKENPDIYIVYTTHHETGSGLLNPIKDIGKLVHKYNAIFVVDTTSSFAMIPINIKKDNIDFCMASSQKGLTAMTGLSFLIGKKTLIEKSKNYPTRSYYCNLYLQYEHFEKTGQMHFTPPVQTIYAAKQALKEYFDEGEKNKYERHKRVFDLISYNLKRLGFKSFIKEEIQSKLVFSAITPNDKNWNFNKIHDYCYKKGFTIYPGKIPKLNTFRVCSLGAIDIEDIKNFFVVFNKALKKYNVSIPVKYKG